MNRLRIPPIMILIVGLFIVLAISTFKLITDEGTLKLSNEKVEAETESELNLIASSASYALSTVSTFPHAVTTYINEADDLPALVASGKLNRYMTDLTQGFTKLRTIVVTDESGNIVEDLRAGRPAVGVDISDRAYFTAHDQNQIDTQYVSEPVVSRVDGKWTWVMSQASRHPDGRLKAVVVISFDSEFFGAMLAQINNPRINAIALIHDNGTILNATGVAAAFIGTNYVFKGSDIREQGVVVKTNSDDALPWQGNAHFHKHVLPWPISVLATISPRYIMQSAQQDLKVTHAWFFALELIIAFLTISTWALFKRLLAANASGKRLVQETAVLHEMAKHANTAKSEFLANMSHELRTPLNSIIGFSQMMDLEIKGPLPAAYHEYTALITQSGRLLLETINTILDIAKIEAGKFEIFKESTDVADLVHEAVALLRLQAEEKSNVIDNRTHDLPRLNIDSLRVKQVLLNIIGNATKFTERGEIVVENSSDENGYDIIITDTGIGMTPEQVQIAIQPFSQVHGSSMSRKYQGTGLGLSLSRQVMSLHDGELFIDSVPDEGTKVTLHFPRETGIN